MLELDARPHGIKYPEYKNYYIIHDANGKFGIVNNATRSTIVKCMFDDIEWLDDIQMVMFYSNHMNAICKICELENTAFSLPFCE